MSFALHINTVFLIILKTTLVERSRGDEFGHIVLYMWGEYFIDILAHKVGKNTNIGHFGYVQFANYGNQCLTVESLF